MWSWDRRVLPLALPACLLGCSFFVPDVRTAAERARQLEPKCRGISEDGAAAILAGNATDSVEPAHVYTMGGPNGREAHLRGAELHLRPLPVGSREALARSLECHEARTVLASGAPRPDDPFVLPGSWVSIAVESAGDGLVVIVTSEDLGDARRILERSQALAARH